MFRPAPGVHRSECVLRGRQKTAASDGVACGMLLPSWEVSLVGLTLRGCLLASGRTRTGSIHHQRMILDSCVFRCAPYPKTPLLIVDAGDADQRAYKAVCRGA